MPVDYNRLSQIRGSSFTPEHANLLEQMRGYDPGEAALARDWNSQVAQQWNTYDQGKSYQPLNFGDFEQNYQNQQAIAALPFQQRQAALAGQHQMQQDAFRNRLALTQEQRMRDEMGFNQELAQERLGFQEGEARRRAAEMALRNQQMSARSQLKGAEERFGVKDVYPLLQNYSQEMGYAEIPDTTGQPKQVHFTPQEFDTMAGMWNQVNPDFPQVSPLIQKAAQRAMPLSPQEQQRKEAYAARIRGTINPKESLQSAAPDQNLIAYLMGAQRPVYSPRQQQGFIGLQMQNAQLSPAQRAALQALAAQ